MRKFCKDVCHLYKAYKDEYSKGYYSEGYKRCIECNLFLDWDGMRCPCCDHVLRIKPHNNRCKARLLKLSIRM
ncbi:hypothetical protein NARC_130043 [Candidatus Nitrosocosmicus arcticus]|uniref:Uncharacterized protein n=1 Tax=Candidatus Nitrosocosmicus arcticus TaxID=2035267 RepID=A0A557SSY3_9ARCH|nr:hypothetical protein NARC_130043 [Candidatus Nitrosocosmicus arcticus]